MLVVRIYSYETLLFAKFVGVHVFILNCIACRLQQRNFKMLSFAGLNLVPDTNIELFQQEEGYV